MLASEARGDAGRRSFPGDLSYITLFYQKSGANLGARMSAGGQRSSTVASLRLLIKGSIRAKCFSTGKPKGVPDQLPAHRDGSFNLLTCGGTREPGRRVQFRFVCAVGLGFESTLLSCENEGIRLFIKPMSLQEQSNNVVEAASEPAQRFSVPLSRTLNKFRALMRE